MRGLSRRTLLDLGAPPAPGRSVASMVLISPLLLGFFILLRTMHSKAPEYTTTAKTAPSKDITLRMSVEDMRFLDARWSNPSVTGSAILSAGRPPSKSVEAINADC
jgi:hypothetical protein